MKFHPKIKRFCIFPTANTHMTSACNILNFCKLIELLNMQFKRKNVSDYSWNSKRIGS